MKKNLTTNSVKRVANMIRGLSTEIYWALEWTKNVSCAVQHPAVASIASGKHSQLNLEEKIAK